MLGYGFLSFDFQNSFVFQSLQRQRGRDGNLDAAIAICDPRSTNEYAFQSLKRKRGRDECPSAKTFEYLQKCIGFGAAVLVAPSLALQALIKTFAFDNY